jgi:hypothetical protein
MLKVSRWQWRGKRELVKLNPAIDLAHPGGQDGLAIDGGSDLCQKRWPLACMKRSATALWSLVSAILESQMRFEVARRVDALGEQQRLEMVLNGMEQVHPGARDHPC